MSKKEESAVNLTPQQIAEMLQNAVKVAINSAKGEEDSWQLANKPFKQKSELEKEAKRYGTLFSRPKSKIDAKKPMEFFETGTFIDKLFLKEDDSIANGIPMVIQLGIVGNPEVGKSILVQEIALRCASKGKRVVFVTSEDSWESSSARFDLQSRFRQKAEIMGLDWEEIRNNLFVFDTITNSELRNWSTFIGTYRYLVEILKGVDLLIVDSLTLLDSYRGALKYRVMELARYNQQHGITAIFVSQRSSEEDVDKFGFAGGVGIGHNLDGTICIDFKKAMSELKEDLNRNKPKDQQIKQWDLVHFVRALGCRLCSIDRKYYEIQITNNGFIKFKTYEVE